LEDRIGVLMTVVAYRNGILASDTLISYETLKVGHIKKIIKTKDGCLAGACGDCEYLAKFLEWADTDRQNSPPKYVKDADGILVLPNGEIRYYIGTSYSIIINDYFALGCGAAPALGAFFMKATAEEAVRAAIEHNTACAGDVIIEKLDNLPEKTVAKRIKK
jgi:hypothetical protein